MEQMRTPFQGVWNIVRFNWHLYALAGGIMILTLISFPYLPPSLRIIGIFGCCAIALSLFVSLSVSHYIYDRSGLYQLHFLDGFTNTSGQVMLNIHAGFDETNALITAKYPGSGLSVFDFYDPVKHTEVSIKRARKAYPAFPGTIPIKTDKLPVSEHTADIIFLLFAAHEIRDDAERAVFFSRLKTVLKPGGHIIVTEHLRDVPNFLAYNIGFLHFLTKRSWYKVFSKSGLAIDQVIKTTPFVNTFILIHGTTS